MNNKEALVSIWRIKTLIHHWGECKMLSLLWKTVLQKAQHKVTMWPPNWKQPKTTLESWSEEQSVVYLYNELSLNHKKEQSAELYYSMDGPWKQCAKWKQPGPKPKYCIIYTIRPEQTNSQGQKIMSGFQVLVGGGPGEWLLLGTGLFLEYGPALELDSGGWLHNFINILKCYKYTRI